MTCMHVLLTIGLFELQKKYPSHRSSTIPARVPLPHSQSNFPAYMIVYYALGAKMKYSLSAGSTSLLSYSWPPPDYSIVIPNV